jgi:hypothetical protein
MSKGTSYALLLGLTLIAAVGLTGCEKLIPVMLPHMLRSWKSEGGSRSLEDGGRHSPSAVENITSEERRVAATLKNAHDPIEEEKRLFKAEIRGAFDDGNFSHLESVIKEIRMSMPRFRDSTWKISSFYEALGERFNLSDAGYKADLVLYEKWGNEFPASTAQMIALADFWTDYAWFARGSGYAATVTEKGRSAFVRRLDKAAKILENAKKMSDNDVYWYRVSLVVALGQGWDAEKYNNLVTEGLRHTPDYIPLLWDRAYSLLPRWYGTEGDWERYAEEQSSTHSAGDEAYAMIVTHLYRFYTDVFTETRADWGRTKRGLEIILQRYPDSLFWWSHTAYLATVARDREFASLAFATLGDNYLPAIWGKPERFVHFRNWAETGNW